ncbi:MAG: enoyl-CoA hydratase-related protein [Nocardioides sp.]
MGHIHYEVEEGVATVTIDRPEKRNAMTYSVLREFTQAIWRAADDPAARVVILTGAGGAFCAGTDLAELDETPEGERGSAARIDDPRASEAWPLASCPKPVIAAVDGAAVGMGAEFATQCDVRIASDRARFGWVFVQRGLVPDTGAGSFLLPRLVGPTAALRLLLSGELVDAAEAERYLAASPFAVARTKRLVYDAMAGERTAHLLRTGAALEECFASEDHAEGVRAFLERRPAAFTGR